MICIGLTAEQIKKWADKKSKKLKQIYKIKNNYQTTIEGMEKNCGFVQTFEKDKEIYYLLWLENFGWSFKWLDILNHEITHLQQFLFKNKGIKNEVEFEAYFHESAYRDIRRLLNK